MNTERVDRLIDVGSNISDALDILYTLELDETSTAAALEAVMSDIDRWVGEEVAK